MQFFSGGVLFLAGRKDELFLVAFFKFRIGGSF
jgi:hypothetical protein